MRVVGVLLARLAVRQGVGSFACHTSFDSRFGALTGRHDEFMLRVCVRVRLAPVHGVQGLGLCARRGKAAVCAVCWVRRG